jgi:hypothetical protein
MLIWRVYWRVVVPLRQFDRGVRGNLIEAMTVGQALAFLVLYGHVDTLVFNYITELLLSSCSRVPRTIPLLVLQTHFQKKWRCLVVYETPAL